MHGLQRAAGSRWSGSGEGEDRTPHSPLMLPNPDERQRATLDRLDLIQKECLVSCITLGNRINFDCAFGRGLLVRLFFDRREVLAYPKANSIFFGFAFHVGVGHLGETAFGCFEDGLWIEHGFVCG